MEIKGDPEKYDIGKKLGRGGFAEVFLCIEKSTSHTYAAKILRYRHIKTGQKEASLLSRLEHCNIISFIDSFERTRKHYLILEFINGCDLSDYLAKQSALTEEETTILLKQILQALAYIHDQRIIHLDIKPGNMLVKEAGSGNALLKLIDFGLAQQLDETSREYKAILGTALFMAPEVVNYNPLGGFTDMWAVGVLVYMMLSGLNPFEGNTSQEVYASIVRGTFSMDKEEFRNCSEDAKDFIHSLLQMEPEKRLTAQQSLHHRWIEPKTVTDMVRRRSSSIHPTNLLQLKEQGALGMRFNIGSSFRPEGIENLPPEMTFRHSVPIHGKASHNNFSDYPSVENPPKPTKESDDLLNTTI